MPIIPPQQTYRVSFKRGVKEKIGRISQSGSKNQSAATRSFQRQGTTEKWLSQKSGSNITLES